MKPSNDIIYKVHIYRVLHALTLSQQMTSPYHATLQFCHSGKTVSSSRHHRPIPYLHYITLHYITLTTLLGICKCNCDARSSSKLIGLSSEQTEEEEEEGSVQSGENNKLPTYKCIRYL